jgi:hypothetical protein
MPSKEYIVKIKLIEDVTRDVKRFVLEKPEGYEFTPGQATLVSINKPELKNKKSPFTFTSQNNEKVLEFTIKKYPEHDGMTMKIHELSPGDELIIREPFGTIHYQDKGVFIAGGAGVTPFIAILRMLQEQGNLKGNKLIFSNKTQKDIILEQEFRSMFGDCPEDLVFTLTREDQEVCTQGGYEMGRIDKEFLKKHVVDFSQNFYVCGPPKFVKSIKKHLEDLGANLQDVVFEGKK